MIWSSMMLGMTPKEKIAVSLPAHLVAAAKRAVRRGRSPNVSAYVAEALEEKARLDDVQSLIDEMLADTGGPLTDAERAAIDREIDAKPRRR